ncbi:DeoR/GlpR family DNA-binding transcription regulator [Lactiplantibacillus paraplantarum]|uniref:DeoR/GlpR family DNA-binding transcription regulator n=1 Tax=Lactiplantibacillus paraplantarum TaxID=60520 RepID=UPI003DA6516F
MNQKERLTLILTQLATSPSLSLKDIMQLTGTSRDTARRDIVKLATNNLVERTYGGISQPNTFNKLDQYLDRDNDLIQTKRALAKKVSPYLASASLLFLDISTTVACLPQYLQSDQPAMLVTNSLDIADQALRHSNFQTRILGGTLDAQQRCVQGADSILELQKFQFTATVLSCAGLTANGVYYAYESDIALKTTLRAQSDRLILVFDHTKVDVKHNFNLLALTDFDLFVTDQPLPEHITRQIAPDKIIYL